MTIQADPYRESLPRMAQLLTAVGQTTSAGTGTEPGFIDRIALSVAIKAPMPLRLDNSLGKVEVVPDIRIAGTVAEPAVVGPADILDGSRLSLQSRTYTLTDSRMGFSAEEGFIPRLQVVGSTNVGEYDVTLRIDGPADAMEMNVSSVRPLPERDLCAIAASSAAASRRALGPGTKPASEAPGRCSAPRRCGRNGFGRISTCRGAARRSVTPTAAVRTS